MQIKAILNRVQKFKSFVYGIVHLIAGTTIPTLEVAIKPRSNGRPICSGCGQKRPDYDRSPERTKELRYICSDMWKPYLKVIKKKAGQAIHILDRFHIMTHLSKAIDEVRAGEQKN